MSNALLDADTEAVLLLDVEDFAPSCDWEEAGVNCPTSAAWSLRCEGCSQVWLLCTPHAKMTAATVARWVPKVARCTACNHQYPDPLPLLPL
jgi:hypothetical protein